MQEIKNFIYLDEYKMYSISSQIFEGITEYLIDHQEDTKQENSTEVVPTGRGRIMADILKSESGTQEKRFLHDYNYTLFEEELEKSGKVLCLSNENIDEDISQIDNVGFIKVRGKAIFNDMNILKSTIKNINELGKAIFIITSFSEMEEARNQFEKAAENTKDRNQKAKLKERFKNSTNIEKLARDSGLNLNDDFLEKLSFILDYGFQDQFEVQIPIDPYIFSSNFNRKYLREDENLLVRKYSRIAEKEFVFFGTVAQSSNYPIDNQEVDNEVYEFQHLKEAIMLCVEKLTVMESAFVGRLTNEIIIDPIAVYREI